MLPNNLHISYDLNSPGQNYQAVIERIKQLGSWAKIHYSFWYVDSTFTPTQAVNHLRPALDPNDRVYVVDAAHNAAAWNDLSNEVADHITSHWNR